MTAEVFERSQDQRLASLRRANEVRFARARMKQHLRTGEASVVEIVRLPPDYVRSMRIYQLLVALPKCGPTKARQLLLRARVADSKTVGGLSPRQRDEIIVELVRSGRG